MAAFPDRPIILKLLVASEHPALLEGLDNWITLGLLSEPLVRKICTENLVCPLPDTAIAPLAAAAPSIPTTDQALVGASDFLPSEPQTAKSAKRSDFVPAPTAPRSPGLLAQAMQSFLAEISVVWLLFLGVFLVVVSSGVLAATQWRTVSPVGQYSILLGYTLIFWLVAEWSRQKDTLRLTHRMLTIATLLIIPVNFWMMDGFRLGQTPIGFGLSAIASVGLTGITLQLLRPTSPPGLILTAIALSWLHWGWGFAGIPLIATYTGTIGATVVLLRHDRRDRPTDPPPAAAIAIPALDTLIIALSTLLLLGRAIFAAQVPIHQVGLALGLCGWLLGWLARHDRERAAWSRSGAGLLVLAWLVTVLVHPPWQAIAISGLALSLLVDSLRRSSSPTGLSVAFLVGLQTNWLLWRVLPDSWQTHIIKGVIAFCGSEAMLIGLLGLGHFPYLVLTLALAVRLRQAERFTLANQAERLALVLGTALTLLSLGNPTVRSLNLTLSTLALLSVTSGRSRPSHFLMHLTHGVALAALFSWIGRWFPTLNEPTWAMILLGVMSLEWLAVMLIPPSNEGPSIRDRGRQTAWHWGLVLAGISYVLLVQLPPPEWAYHPWNPVWLLVPTGLTLLAHRDRPLPSAPLASHFSVGALLLAQLLLLGATNGRLIGFGVATLLMLFNTRQLYEHWAAVLTVGFGLALWGASWYAILEPVTLNASLLLLAGTVWGLWLIRMGFRSRRSHLAGFYRDSLDGWAIAVFLPTVLLLTAQQLLVYFRIESPGWPPVWAAGILVVACTYRRWQGATSQIWWAIAGSLELLIVSSIPLLIGFPNESSSPALTTLAISNLALGGISLLLGNRFLHQTAPDSPTVPLNWHLIPIGYALLGVLCGHDSFTATTGLYTAAGALVGLGIGRRSPPLKPLTYLALAGLSWAAYEALVYQLLQAPAGQWGDGLVWLAGLAAGFALLYRLLRRSLPAYLHLTPTEVQAVGHSHWLVGSGLLLLAVMAGMSRSGQGLGAAIAALLAVYALLVGRRVPPIPPPPLAAQGWTSFGILELLLALTLGLRLWLPDTGLIDWGGAIAALIAVGFCLIPWPNWGWYRQPWEQVAAWLPGVAIMLTAWGINLQSLLLAGAFYAWNASRTRQIRLSYASVLIANWAIARLLIQANRLAPLWLALLIGGSLLYLAQVDPIFQSQSARDRRHWLRSLATALICLTAFYQAEVGIAGIAPVAAGFGAIALAFGFILLGLFLQVRAFLYIGTAAFIIQVFWQLWRFFSDYSLLLTVVGIVAGALLIWGAATFEARRSQVNTLLQRWMTDLEIWE